MLTETINVKFNRLLDIVIKLAMDRVELANRVSLNWYISIGDWCGQKTPLSSGTRSSHCYRFTYQFPIETLHITVREQTGAFTTSEHVSLSARMIKLFSSTPSPNLFILICLLVVLLVTNYKFIKILNVIITILLNYNILKIL